MNACMNERPEYHTPMGAVNFIFHVQTCTRSRSYLVPVLQDAARRTLRLRVAMLDNIIACMFGEFTYGP